MLTSNLKLDVLTFATVAVPATPTATFSAIHNQDIQNNATFLTETPAGHPAPLFGAVSHIKPTVAFTTPQIDVTANALTAWGAAVAAKTYQKKSSGVAPLARSGTVHVKHEIAQAVACWTQMTLPALGIASANVQVYPIWNGTGSGPIVQTASVALPSGVLVPANYFAAGPVYLGGVGLVDGVQTISSSSGATFRGEGDASTVFDTYGEINVPQTIVTITTKNKVNWGSVPMGGLRCTLDFFAKKWANESLTSFEADESEVHMLFSNTNCIAIPVNTQSDGQNLYSDTVHILCIAPDDTHAPLAVSLLQAITDLS